MHIYTYTDINLCMDIYIYIYTMSYLSRHINNLSMHAVSEQQQAERNKMKRSGYTEWHMCVRGFAAKHEGRNTYNCLVKWIEPATTAFASA